MPVSAAERSCICVHIITCESHRRMHGHATQKIPPRRSICRRRDVVVCFSFTMRSRSQPCCYSARYPGSQKLPNAVLRRFRASNPRIAVSDLEGNFAWQFHGALHRIRITPRRAAPRKRHFRCSFSTNEATDAGSARESSPPYRMTSRAYVEDICANSGRAGKITLSSRASKSRITDASISS